jgi:hypothetical protein
MSETGVQSVHRFVRSNHSKRPSEFGPNGSPQMGSNDLNQLNGLNLFKEV